MPKKKEEIIYFELDNWESGTDYPDVEPFIEWMGNDYDLRFGNDEWCKKNKLCVEAGLIDMSACFCISATKTWVMQNCPKLLTNEICGKEQQVYCFDDDTKQYTTKREFRRYSDFVCKPDKDGKAYGRISGWPFREYKEENFGVHENDWYWEAVYEKNKSCDTDET